MNERTCVCVCVCVLLRFDALIWFLSMLQQMKNDHALRNALLAPIKHQNDYNRNIKYRSGGRLMITHTNVSGYYHQE